MKHAILNTYHRDTVVLQCLWCGANSGQHFADETQADNPALKQFTAKHPHNCTNKG